MFHLAMTVVALLQTGISIRDASGIPVPGASVCSDTALIAFSGPDGSLELPDPPDSIEVLAIGHLPWSGPVPTDGVVTLTTLPVRSGLVVNVTAPRRGLRDRYPSTTVLGREEMARIHLRGLGALGSGSSGIYVRQYGGAMPVISISIRGAPSAHAGYFVDGHPLESCMSGVPAMIIDPAVFGSLEIARGGGSGLLQSGMSGTLNFLPYSAESGPSATLAVDDRGGGRISAGLPLASGRLAMSMARMVAAGGSTAFSATLLHTGRTGVTRYGIMTTASGGETEAPDWSPPTDATRDILSLDGWIRTGMGPFSLSGDLNAGRTRYSSTVPTSTDDDHRGGGAMLTVEFDPGLAPPAGLSLLAGAEYDLVRSSSTGDNQRATCDLASRMGLTLPMATFSGALRLSMADGDSPIPGALLNIGVPVADTLLMLHASGSRGFRRPTFSDLYWPEDQFAVGNPDLRPETSWEIEAGFSLVGSRPFSLSVTAFQAFTDDLIRWEPSGSGKWSPVNIARVRRRGIEGETHFSTGIFTLSGSLTLLEVTDDDPASTNYGLVLPYTPDHTFGIHLEVEPLDDSRVWLSLEGMGPRFRNYSETSWLEAYSVLSAGLELPLPVVSGLTAGISASNILDEDYEETDGYPGSPRTLAAVLRWGPR